MTIRSILLAEKLTGSNFTNWYRNLRIVLRRLSILSKRFHVLCMSPDLQRNLEKYNAYDMLKELKTMFKEQVKYELFETVKAFHTYKQEEGKTIAELHAILKHYKKGISKKAETPTVLAIREDDNVFYFNAIPRDGIYEIDIHSLYPNVSSMFNVRNKRSKHALDSSYLWHCHHGYINKKRIDKLQCDGILQPTHDESLKKCKSCISGKMACKPFPHQVERSKDLLGLIHIDVYGPFRTVSREGASYFITFTDDFCHFGYVYLMKHKHEVERMPYEIWHEKAPKLSNLRVWGCEALVKQDAPNKLDPRSIKCIFIGYLKEMMASGSHRLLELSGSDGGLELIQEEDTQPSKNTSEIDNEVAPIEVEPQNVEVPIHRSARIPQAPDKFGFYVDVKEYELGDLNELPNYKAALSDLEFDKWLEAMNTEMQSMKDNQVWVLVDLLPNGQNVRSKWLFKKNIGMDGNVQNLGEDEGTSFAFDLHAPRFFDEVQLVVNLNLIQLYSKRSLKDKIICDLNKTPDLFQEPPQNCPKCENPVDGQYCQGCALLRKKFKQDLFTYCIENGIFQDFQDTSEPSNDNTNVVKQDPDKNSSQRMVLIMAIIARQKFWSHNQNVDELPQNLTSFHPTCYSGDEDSFVLDSISNIVHDSPNVFNPPLQPPTYSYEFCDNDAYYGHDCPLQFPVIHQPICEKMCAELLAKEQDANINTQPFQYSVVHQPPQEEISVEFLQEKRNQIDYVKTFLRKFNRIYFYEMPKVLSLAWETILEIEHAFEDKHCQPEDILKLFRIIHNDVQNIHEELAVYINAPSWDCPTICYNNDDDEDCTIAITPILSTKEPDNSLSMEDEHLDTILATKSDELIKSSVENLVPIPSESEGIPDNMCNVPFHDNSPPLDVSKDQFEDFSDSSDDSTSINDDSFFIDDIEYVEASPPDYELVSLEVMEIVIPKKGGIDSSSNSFNFLLEETNTFDNSLPESKTFCFDLEEISSGSTTTHFDISLSNYEAFYDDHVKEISSGSTTTHSDFSLYDSFIFDLSINPFPPADRGNFYHEEFVDELAHIISPPEYDCFSFKNEPNLGDFTMDVVDDTFSTREPRVHVHNILPTHPTLQLNLVSYFLVNLFSLMLYGSFFPFSHIQLILNIFYPWE
uniref:Uncharacterized protein n=1 Tax=Tanacetum cinerariifolium TaxID=118510 RepID=A0A6L2MAL4_TANCI|nr:hypothetical protein [Tanacetum cinerariifolium]